MNPHYVPDDIKTLIGAIIVVVLVLGIFAPRLLGAIVTLPPAVALWLRDQWLQNITYPGRDPSYRSLRRALRDKERHPPK